MSELSSLPLEEYLRLREDGEKSAGGGDPGAVGYSSGGGVRGVELSELTLAALREAKLAQPRFESQV